MRIIATFVNFKDHPDEIELIHAWDEYTVDSNGDGYSESLEDALGSYGGEILNTVEVFIEVPEAEIRERLRDPVIVAGKVAVT